ncbi:MAG: hypothetical protein M1829_004695 [Trizodia sp. TS-e1964]|nr:MAG: hypothetical protein M1829_004695 [Trizodia sp. TS-e1964]
MSEPSQAPELLEWLAYQYTLATPLIQTYTHLLFSALLLIFIGSHASLSRPSSAAASSRGNKEDSSATQLEDDLDDDEGQLDEEAKMEALQPQDALLFPLMAGLTLAGLYFLIKWLGDASLINMVLTYYFTVSGFFSTGKLIANAIDVLASFAFPMRWSDGGLLWVAQNRAKLVVCNSKDTSSLSDAQRTPLPTLFSRISLPRSLLDAMWAIRKFSTEKLKLSVYVRGIIHYKSKFGVNDIVGLSLGLGTVITYNYWDKPWWLTNLLGFGLSYGALQLLSPTTFVTSTLLLSGLFIYDIYFVFYTPLMVTVATYLEIPIKLLFPKPAGPDSKYGYAMLGLGDIVIPGIVIGLALRYDLYLFYLKKQTIRQVIKNVRLDQSQTKTIMDSPRVLRSNRSKNRVIEPLDYSRKVEDILKSSKSEHTPAFHFVNDEAVGKGKNKPEIETVKARYLTASGGWGERFWTSSSLQSLEGGAFPKPYFTASMIGYTIGLLATLCVMQVWGHAQPALLYLVPGVLGSLWGTAFVRGEVNLMWNFSESGDEEDKAGKESAEAHAERKIKQGPNATSPRPRNGSESQKDGEKDILTSAQEDHSNPGKPRDIIRISITAPP